ncbi:helix-turn-helix transcriptional regulator [Cryobacterium tepidiphilum]|uniref:Helix-turn-helix domain-containing protein n=1 Tax=Cryobacterium tepidiphilum TaxID=2486026 RepID=A0A3M8L9Y7_9MICO|nr:AraC family transcriptional regulator [Cryobacterium tepidiphilum]RNE62256.1 helix-turn-helix domain-containing protein [Cryobacterium tepidiphilum]
MTDDERFHVRLEAVGRDPEIARHTLSGFYDGAEWKTHATTARAYSYRYAAIGDNAMTLRTSQMNGYVEGDIPPGDDYIVQWLTGGHAIVDMGGDAVPLTVGRPMLFPAHRPFVFGFTDYQQKLVHLNRQQVDAVATELHGAVPGSIRFDHLTRPSAASIALWHETVALVSRTVARGSVSPVLWNELIRMTAVSFLEMYAPNAAHVPEALRHPRNAHVRLAVEYIHEYAHLPLAVAQIAEIAGLSVRALQESFQRTLGMSPMAHLRLVRLERAHEDLLAGAPPATTVGDIARRWGFAHLGRFSAAYGERFGEHPRDTLRR